MNLAQSEYTLAPGRRKYPSVRQLYTSTADALKARKATAAFKWVFPDEAQSGLIRPSAVAHQHKRVREKLKLDKEFVAHSLRHSALMRLADEAIEAAFERFEMAGEGHTVVPRGQRQPNSSRQVAVNKESCYQ
jgi:integrase